MVAGAGLEVQLFRETGYWDKGFQVSILVEEDNPTFTPVGLILKDSLEKLNPKFRVNVVQVESLQVEVQLDPVQLVWVFTFWPL